MGGQPSREDLQKLREEGFKSIVNLRTEGEEDQPLGPQEEGEVVRGLGMEYVHIPVSMDTLGKNTVDAFGTRLSTLPKPVFVHCSAGKRSGAFTLMVTAAQQGMTGDAALQKAEEMGFECDVPQLKAFVKGYVDSHPG